ncbi:hypothetical protein EUTSA_v10022238mg, partial [Eutrema salsugineum]
KKDKMEKKDVPPPPPPPPPPRFNRFHRLNPPEQPPPRRRPIIRARRINMTSQERCPLAHPTQPRHLLQFRKLEHGCFSCFSSPDLGEYGLYCTTCDVEFCRLLGCHKLPRKITHPFHLQHPLSLSLTKLDLSKFYRCSICNLCLDLSCSENIPLLVITNPKSHHHSLVLYPRPLLTPCDACGLVNVLEPSYACFQCNYMVHQSCMDLPRVIKITRHQHRLCHTPYLLQSTVSPCRICYKTVDINDLIRHFSHEHLLKLYKYDGVRDAEKQCHACILPINSLDFYNCRVCDFFLHEICAGLLRKMDHALHIHTLVLDPSPLVFPSLQGCSVCSRKFTGFRYNCSNDDCVLDNQFQIDARCILVPDYFTHESHEHPLFISTSHKAEGEICCKGCKEVCLKSYMQCTVCKFALCYQCATIPNEVVYKYDKHPLSLCYGQGAEEEINPMHWFYTCNECCTTIHVECVFGSSVYMKPGFIFNYRLSNGVKVLRNSNSTRRFCTSCGYRCPSAVYYYKINYDAASFCSLYCLKATCFTYLN